MKIFERSQDRSQPLRCSPNELMPSSPPSPPPLFHVTLPCGLEDCIARGRCAASSYSPGIYTKVRCKQISEVHCCLLEECGRCRADTHSENSETFEVGNNRQRVQPSLRATAISAMLLQPFVQMIQSLQSPIDNQRALPKLELECQCPKLRMALSGLMSSSSTFRWFAEHHV